ncbi:MAG TPA: ABC transporter permease [Terriglobia bacterium]|nr:ABC transporter permease [Terriglobia bacterium]
MRFRDLLEIVRGDLERNVRRTLLTMFGLIVGSAAVVVVTSVGLAGREYAVEQLESLGSNLVYAWYDGPTPSPNDLNEDDYHDIRARVTALAQVSRLATDSTTLNIQGEPYNVTLVGTDGVYARVRNIVLQEGRFISAFDLDDRRKVCVLPESLAFRLFGNGQRLGRLVPAEGFNFQVVGVFRDVHSFSIPTELSQNAMIIPLTVLAAMGNTNRVDRIYGQAKSSALVERATQQMTQILAGNHGTDVIYRVGNLGEVLNVVHRVSSGLILLVSVVSAISLLVGGVGIMNIMLVTVRERTPEIGLRKALGATSRQILDAFLLEAVMISVTGGGLGILLGGGMPIILAAIFDVRIPVSSLSVILALVVASSVGVFFGYYPAHRAARLNPVQALRYD